MLSGHDPCTTLINNILYDSLLSWNLDCLEISTIGLYTWKMDGFPLDFKLSEINICVLFT